MSAIWKFPWEPKPRAEKKAAFSERLATSADIGKRLVIGIAAIIGGIAAVFVMTQEIFDDQVRIDTFHVSQDLEKCGWTGEVVARKLLDGRAEIAKRRRLIARG